MHHTRRLFSSSTTFKFNWLDLRGSGLSILERLLLEEALLRHDDNTWMIMGHHEATPLKYIKQNLVFNENPSSSIILGIGGKPHELINIPLLKQEPCLTIKRFSGGGTVVLDYDSIWTTIITRNLHVPDLQPFPRPIMEWTAEQIFNHAFQYLQDKQSQSTNTNNNRNTMILDTKSCSFDNSGRTVTIPSKVVTIPQESNNEHTEIPQFSLRENDYVLGHRKMGGNAQSIVKDGWLHHTSFLWDYQQENMDYLTLPKKRPEYRKDRDHSEFLVKLCEVYPNLTKRDLYDAVYRALDQNFTVDKINVKDATKVIDQLGGWETWFEKSRNKILQVEDL